MLINGCVQDQEEFASRSISLLSSILKISGAESQRRADPSFLRLPSLLPHCGFSSKSKRNAIVQQLISMAVTASAVSEVISFRGKWRLGEVQHRMFIDCCPWTTEPLPAC